MPRALALFFLALEETERSLQFILITKPALHLILVQTTVLFQFWIPWVAADPPPPLSNALSTGGEMSDFPHVTQHFYWDPGSSSGSK